MKFESYIFLLGIGLLFISATHYELGRNTANMNSKCLLSIFNEIDIFLKNKDTIENYEFIKDSISIYYYVVLDEQEKVSSIELVRYKCAKVDTTSFKAFLYTIDHSCLKRKNIEDEYSSNRFCIMYSPKTLDKLRNTNRKLDGQR